MLRLTQLERADKIKAGYLFSFSPVSRQRLQLFVVDNSKFRYFHFSPFLLSFTESRFAGLNSTASSSYAFKNPRIIRVVIRKGGDTT